MAYTLPFRWCGSSGVELHHYILPDVWFMGLLQRQQLLILSSRRVLEVFPHTVSHKGAWFGTVSMLRRNALQKKPVEKGATRCWCVKDLSEDSWNLSFIEFPQVEGPESIIVWHCVTYIVGPSNLSSESLTEDCCSDVGCFNTGGCEGRPARGRGPASDFGI